MQPPGRVGQAIAEGRVGDRDQCARPLPQRLAVELRHAKLGDNGMDIVAAGDHSTALIKHRHDSRERIAFRRRWQRDDRLTSFGAGVGLRLSCWRLPYSLL